jgi:carboxyl-terminal processing protease
VQTFGKGSVQSIIELPGGAGLKLTTARYYTPSGRSIQAQGITPDVVVEATRVIAPPTGNIVKEKDLEHALAAEGGKPTDAGVPPTLGKDAGPSDAATDAAEPPPPVPGKKPDIEKDFPLRMAHQIVTGILMKKKGP